MISGRLGALLGLDRGQGDDAGVFAAHAHRHGVWSGNPAGASGAPDEHADADDCAVGVQALATVLETLLTTSTLLHGMSELVTNDPTLGPTALGRSRTPR
ncbi:MAG: hypothetical protein U0R72_18845 [Nakamurella multipartita]